jgi:hypothetical protein
MLLENGKCGHPDIVIDFGYNDFTLKDLVKAKLIVPKEDKGE